MSAAPTTKATTDISSLAVRSQKEELKAINAWVLDHLPCDDKQALLDRAREFRGATLVFKEVAAKRVQAWGVEDKAEEERKERLLDNY
jgi:hypothetical protein